MAKSEKTADVGPAASAPELVQLLSNLLRRPYDVVLEDVLLMATSQMCVRCAAGSVIHEAFD